MGKKALLSWQQSFRRGELIFDPTIDLKKFGCLQKISYLSFISFIVAVLQVYY